VAGEEKQRRVALGELLAEIGNDLVHLNLGRVFLEQNLEALAAQRGGDRACVVGRIPQRRFGIGPVADDQRDFLAGKSRACQQHGRADDPEKPGEMPHSSAPTVLPPGRIYAISAGRR